AAALAPSAVALSDVCRRPPSSPFTAPPPPEVYPLSLHDALPIFAVLAGAVMNRTTGSAKTAFTYAAGLVGSVLLITTVMRRTDRSEEHTSELQSRFDLVCRLLLEKKKRSGNEGVVDEGPIGHIRL